MLISSALVGARVLGRSTHSFGDVRRVLAVGSELSNLPEAGANQRHRKPALHHLVQRFDEGFELRAAEKLDLVKEQHHAMAVFLGSLAECDEQVSQVGGEVLVIGKSFGCIDVEAKRPVTVGRRAC